MKDFSTYNGDVVVSKTIEMVSGAQLLQQKVERVLGTNKGEWSYDPEEGIDFAVVLCKGPHEDEIRSTIEEALWKVDDTFAITEFSLEMLGRNAVVRFKAVNGDGEEVGGEYTYGS